jgi:hypothetical protein
MKVRPKRRGQYGSTKNEIHKLMARGSEYMYLDYFLLDLFPRKSGRTD